MLYVHEYGHLLQVWSALLPQSFLLEVTDRAYKNLIYAVHCVMGYKDQVEGSYGFLKVISFLEFHA